MARILIVSNRLPLNVSRDKTGLCYKESAGGLATGLSSCFDAEKENVWIGWPGLPLEDIRNGEREGICGELRDRRYRPVFLSRDQVDRYYYGFCNRTIWPLMHYFNLYCIYDPDFWESYREVNERFRDAVLEEYRTGDTIWVHDYHLMLLPGLLREKVPEASIGFFLHIPFPSMELFRALPWRQEILRGLLGADLVGFHTHDYARHFCDSIRRILGYEHTFGRIQTGERLIQVDAFAMGIDYARFVSAMEGPETCREVEKIHARTGGKKIILSIDRLDYSKGIPQRLAAYDAFLEKHPDQREQVVLILKLVASRTQIDDYHNLKREVDEMVGRINGKYGNIHWMPVWYMYCYLPFETMIALYGAADVCLVTPLRDGMNLIAKEYVAACIDGRGALVLSETAGAAQELSEALLINPNSQEEMQEALETALAMPAAEQEERNREMQKRLERYDVMHWSRTFLRGLDTIRDRQKFLEARALSGPARQRLLDGYTASRRALLLLDYDGSLVPFSRRPEAARPDPELRELLGRLGSDPHTDLAIISGRDRRTLEEWLGDLPLSLSAEHGLWVREEGGEWEALEILDDRWKEEVRPVLELYVDRTPGALVEEKEHSLVWHYRKVEPGLARARQRELHDELYHLIGSRDLTILEGNKVVEVKNAAISKGRAAQRWLAREPDFILAMGDDQTDEATFAVLPAGAWGIRVGPGLSLAPYSIPSFREARALLEKLRR